MTPPPPPSREKGPQYGKKLQKSPHIRNIISKRGTIGARRGTMGTRRGGGGGNRHPRGGGVGAKKNHYILGIFITFLYVGPFLLRFSPHWGIGTRTNFVGGGGGVGKPKKTPIRT